MKIDIKAVKEIMLDKGWTIAYLARRMGMTQGALGELLRSTSKRKSNRYNTIHRLAQGLGVNWREIVEIKGEDEYE